MQDRKAENGQQFVPPQERPVQPGVGDLHDGRPVVDGVVVIEFPGRVLVGRVDTTKQTLK